MTSIFEKATRLKIRYKLTNGFCSVEDLWDLPLPRLNELAKGLHKKINDDTVSFIETKSKTNTKDVLAFDIVLRVIEVRTQEAEVAEIRVQNQIKKNNILKLIAEKKNEQLSNLTIEELSKQLAALD